MTVFKDAVDEALTLLKTIEEVTELDEKEKRVNRFKVKDIVWRVVSEIFDKNGLVIQVGFNVLIPKDFPLGFPKIYLEQNPLKELRFLPHLDNNKFICTFDQDLTKTDVNNPKGIILACLKKAKNILQDGLSGKNTDDYEEEFLAYWGDSYVKNRHRNDFISLINPEDIPTNPVILRIENPENGYNYIIHDNDLRSDNFKEALALEKINYLEEPCFYCGHIKLSFLPPFDYTSKQISQILEQLTKEKKEGFIKYINSDTKAKFVLATVIAQNKKIFIGWLYNTLNTNINGFRKGSLSPYDVMSTIQSSDKIMRASPEIFTLERLIRRTSGSVRISEFRFAIGGLGSVGSNLLHFLNSFNFPEFRLIDEDKLRVENIGRHLLGFNFLFHHKTLGLKQFLLEKTPIQSIQTREDSVVNIIENELDFLNDADFIFVATGRSNIETWIGEAVEKGIIVKPVFFIWVEPFLAGGHCIYLSPGSSNYKSFFTADLTFKSNVIGENYYKDPLNVISLKEAGCQTSYIPYSGGNLIAFIAALFPKLTAIIYNKEKNSKAFTWIGNVDELKKNGIELSSFAQNATLGQIIEI